MTQSQITLAFMVLAILATAILLFRQGALGAKAMSIVFTVTLGLGGWLFWTLTTVR